MKTEILSAKTVRIDHPEASYGIFCFNSAGDLFLNSDWGFYGYAWRAFGDDFHEFLQRANAEYIVGKFQINHSKKLAPHQRKMLEILVNEFRAAIHPNSI